MKSIIKWLTEQMNCAVILFLQSQVEKGCGWLLQARNLLPLCGQQNVIDPPLKGAVVCAYVRAWEKVW